MTMIINATLFCPVKGEQVTFSMAIGNVELMHKCFPNYLLMRTSRIK